MDLTINRNHARLGKRSRPMKCPTALALKAEGFIGVRVDGEMVEARTKGERRNWWNTRYDLSAKLMTAIEEYDKGAPFKTGTYRISGLKRPLK